MSRSRSAPPTGDARAILDIDGDAPVVARAEADVQAPPERIFGLIADVASWPRWNPDVRAASIDGPFVHGSRFRWKAGPGSITSTVEHVEFPRRIVWTGRTTGIRAIHVYELVPHDARTTVISRESWDGLLVRILRKTLERTLRRSLEAGLRHLAEEALRSGRSSGGGDGSRPDAP